MHHRQTTGTIISRITAGVLCLLMFFFAVPLNLYAEAIDALENAHNAVASDAGQDLYSYLGAAYEVESLREEYVKHFHLEDGTYVAARYPYPVHEKTADGSFCDIDNRLSETAGGLFANADTRVKFAKKITGNETLFTLHEKGTKLTLGLQGAKKGTAGRVENGSDAQDATTLQKLLHLENLSSKILYPDILPGADLEYVVGSGNIKENLLVKERAEVYSYTFDLRLGGRGHSPHRRRHRQRPLYHAGANRIRRELRVRTRRAFVLHADGEKRRQIRTDRDGQRRMDEQ